MIPYWRDCATELPVDMMPVIVCVEYKHQATDSTGFYPFQTVGRLENGRWVISSGPNSQHLKSQEEVTYWMPWFDFPCRLKYR